MCHLLKLLAGQEWDNYTIFLELLKQLLRVRIFLLSFLQWRRGRCLSEVGTDRDKPCGLMSLLNVEITSHSVCFTQLS